MAYESVNKYDPEGGERWESAGRPVVPALEVDGVATPIIHTTQIASLLGLPTPPALESTRIGYDLVVLLESWDALIRPLSWELLNRVTPSRGRTVKVLTYNALCSIEPMRDAWETRVFLRETSDRDVELSAPLDTPEKVAAFAGHASDVWTEFMLSAETTIAVADPVVATPRGDILYSEFMVSKRWTTAFHHRQLIEFLASQGVEPADAFRVEMIPDLKLPATVFS